MKIGTYYYPEQWPRGQWERDFDNIVKLGMQIVHMGEFAWFDMEPREGEFQLDWLEECVEMARARGLGVILCTPTASPPVWLVEKYPGMLPVNGHGERDRFGGRRHYNPLSPEFQEATRKIVTALAERFGEHPAVMGWQIDNEYSHAFDQSEVTHGAFRKWLCDKYGDISGLNQAWGNQFWNTYYTSFEEILMPAQRAVGYGNPHQCLDASRFWSWAFARFNKIQTEILKPRIGKRFLTTNFMPLHADCDPADMAEDLTLSSWDSYPVSGWDRKIVDETFRIANPDSIGLIHDLMGSYQNRWALMELQPGQINWSGVPVRVFPGAIRLWIWTAIAHGAEFVTTYRYRQPRFGVELFHHGLMGTDGVTASTGGEEFSRVAREREKLDWNQIPELKEEELDLGRTVGLVLDFEQNWYFLTLPQAKRWNWVRYMEMWYGALSRLGLKVKILRPGQEWPGGLKLIVAPALQMVDEGLVRQLENYARGGGHLVLTCRTGLMDRHGQLFEGETAKAILPMIGGRIEAYDSLPEVMVGKIEMDGKEFEWGVWGDQVEPGEGTEVLAKYADQFYAGAAAVTRGKFGKGVVSYFGVFSELPLMEAFVEKTARGIAGLKVMELPTRVRVMRRGKYWIALNYQDKAVDAPAGEGAKFIFGARRMEAAGVAVWEE